MERKQQRKSLSPQQKLLGLFEELSPQCITEDLPDNIIPRPYQATAISNVFESWLSNQSTLVVLPTGTGKTVVFSEVMRSTPTTGRLLVLAHRTELIHQAKNHAERAGLTAGIEMAHHRVGNEDVVVSSIQTQVAPSKCKACLGDGCDDCEQVGKIRRMERFNPHDFSLLIIDEAHHAAAKSYRLVLEYYKKNPNLKIMMVTATPKRHDNIGLHNVCESVAYEMDLKEAIDEGWLVPIKQKFVSVEDLDLSAVPKAMGDIQGKGLCRAWLGDTDEDEERMLHSVAKPTLDQAGDSQVLVFASGQDHAKKLCAAFRAYDVTAEFVIDSTPRQARKDIIERYKSGKVQVLVNCGVFLEGFDHPAIQVVANARPTASKPLYMQIIGRGTRPLSGVVDREGLVTALDRKLAIQNSDKPFMTVLDFVGSSGRHKLVSAFDVLAGDDLEPLILAEAIQLAREQNDEVDVEELIEQAETAIAEQKAAAELAKQELITKNRALKAKYRSEDIDLFSGDEFIVERDFCATPFGPTAKQCSYLAALGVGKSGIEKIKSQSQAGKVIDSLKKRTGADFRVSFGKYKGRSIEEVPDSYLRWVQKNLTGDIVNNIDLYFESKNEYAQV